MRIMVLVEDDTLFVEYLMDVEKICQNSAYCCWIEECPVRNPAYLLVKNKRGIFRFFFSSVKSVAVNFNVFCIYR